MDRRGFLGFLGGASIAGLAGCGDGLRNGIEKLPIDDSPSNEGFGDLPEVQTQPASGNFPTWSKVMANGSGQLGYEEKPFIMHTLGPPPCKEAIGTLFGV